MFLGGASREVNIVGYLEMDGVEWKDLLKWMMTGGTAISGNPHLIVIWWFPDIGVPPVITHFDNLKVPPTRSNPPYVRMFVPCPGNCHGVCRFLGSCRVPNVDILPGCGCFCGFPRDFLRYSGLSHISVHVSYHKKSKAFSRILLVI